MNAFLISGSPCCMLQRPMFLESHYKTLGVTLTHMVSQSRVLLLVGTFSHKMIPHLQQIAASHIGPVIHLKGCARTCTYAATSDLSPFLPQLSEITLCPSNNDRLKKLLKGCLHGV